MSLSQFDMALRENGNYAKTNTDIRKFNGIKEMLRLPQLLLPRSVKLPSY
jgi:hypothetical protein